MDPVYYVFIAITFILLGLWISFPNIREILRIRRIPTHPIGALPEKGKVKVVGRAYGSAATSPITRTECALWEVKVDAERSSGGGNPNWVRLYRGSSSEPFEISDDTGKITIQPAGASLLLWHDYEETSGFSNPLDPDTQSALEKLGLQGKGYFGGKRVLRVHERSITQDDRIYVVGELQPLDGRVVIAGGAGSPLIISEFGEKDLLGKLTEQAFAAFFKTLIGGFLVIFFLWLISSL